MSTFYKTIILKIVFSYKILIHW